MDNKLTELINKFNLSKNSELEIRFTVNFYLWKQLYEKILINNSGSIEQSINAVINQEKGRDRKEIYLENGIKKSEKYVNKNQIERLVYYNKINYRISLAEEIEVKPFDIKNVNDIRLKLRSSILDTSHPKWRFDFTLVKTLSGSDIQNIAKYKEQIFPINKKIDIINFISFIEKNPDKNYSTEFELEYLDKKISEQDITEIINFIFNLTNEHYSKNQDEYHREVYELAKLLLKEQDLQTKNKDRKPSDQFKNLFSLKQLANAPIGLDTKTYINKVLPHIDQYYLSDKADGDRCLLWIQDDYIKLITSNKVIEINIDLDKKYFHGHTILDLEVINLDAENKKFTKAYIFDILYLNDLKLTDQIMDVRNQKIDLLNNKLGKNIEKKILVKLSNTDDPDSSYKIQINNIYNRAIRLYPIDGLIFTPNFSDQHYIKYNIPENYFDMIVYKWKPPEKLTIDFLAIECPKNLLGIEPYIIKENYTLYLLFCGIRYKMYTSLNFKKIRGYDQIFDKYKLGLSYFPIQFSPSINQYAYLYYHPIDSEFKKEDINGHTVEFVLSLDSFQEKYNEWKIVKLRPDKDILIKDNSGYGNDFKTAEATYLQYQNPLTLKMLIENEKTTQGAMQGAMQGSDQKPYFLKQKSNIYRCLTKFNGFVKAQLIRQLQNSNLIIDLASGQGSDLFTINSMNIKNGLFIDQDQNALEELNRRKYEFNNDKFYIYNSKPETNILVLTKKMNLTENYKSLVEQINIKADGVIINFAIHYLIKDSESMDNFINLIDNILKPGGVFIFTCFSGEKIHDLLKNIKKDQSWDLIEDDYLKYSIKKLYEKENDYGDQIGVIHPFSMGEYYSENILNLDLIIKSFKEKKYILRQFGSFGDWLNKFKKFNPNIYQQMTSNDIIYSSLYSYCSLWKST